MVSIYIPPIIASIADLHAALVKDNIGKYDRSHNEMPGYSWKTCCVYDYRKYIKWQGSVTPSNPTPRLKKENEILEHYFENPIIHREIHGEKVYVPLNLDRVWNRIC